MFNKKRGDGYIDVIVIVISGILVLALAVNISCVYCKRTA